jgi:hypothetical protein
MSANKAALRLSPQYAPAVTLEELRSFAGEFPMRLLKARHSRPTRSMISRGRARKTEACRMPTRNRTMRIRNAPENCDHGAWN